MRATNPGTPMRVSLLLSRMLLSLAMFHENFLGCYGTSSGIKGWSLVKYGSFCHSLSTLDTKFTYLHVAHVLNT